MDRESVDRALERLKPWAVINCAGYVRVDDAESDAERCQQVNVEGPRNLAAGCLQHDVKLIGFSSDLVFDGERATPYLESHSARPRCVYGWSKLEAERQVLSENPSALMIRTSAFFGPADQYNFLIVTLRRLAAQQPVRAAEDWIVSPTYVPDLVHACLDLAVDGEAGIWHLANAGMVSWADFARSAARELGFDVRSIVGCSGEELGLAAPRPRFSALGSERGLLLPGLQDGIRRFCDRARHSGGLRLSA